MTGLSLRRNFTWTLAGNVVYAACLWAQLAMLTKLGDASAVGRFALASAVSTPAIVLAQLQLRSVFASDAQGQFLFRDYLGVRLVLLAPALVVVLTMGLVAYSRAQVVAIAFFAAGRAVESVSDMYYGYAQRHERLDLVALSMMIKGLVGMAAFGLTFALTSSVTWALAANAVAWLVPLLAFDIPRCRALARLEGPDSLRPRWQWSSARRLMTMALPMGLVMLAIQMRITIPRTLLEAHRGEAELGVYSALAYLAIAGTTIVYAMSQASLARLGRHAADGRADLMRGVLSRMLRLALVIGIAGVIVAWLAGAPLLRFIYADEYGDHAGLLVLIMIDGGLMYLASLLGAPATAMRLFGSQLVIHGVNVVLMGLVGLLLIPRLGMTGAAWTMIAGSAWVTVAYAWVVRRGLRALTPPEVDGVS